MEIELFERILKELKNHTKYLYFHVMGEPLLHPKIDVFLDLCNDYEYKVNITTNGVLVREAKSKLLSKPSLRLINFSLHSFESNTLNNTMDDYIDDIFNFSRELSVCSEVVSCLRLWNVGKDNFSSIEERADKNQYILRKIEKFFNFPCTIKEVPMAGNGIKLIDRVYLSQASCFSWPDIKTLDLDMRGFCLGLREQAAVLVDGTVVPCCLDSEGTINLGNIGKLAFSDIIEGKRAMNIYNGFSSREIVEPLCRKCGYRKRFDLKMVRK